MYKGILVATAGSRLSGKAVTHAIALAKALGIMDALAQANTHWRTDPRKSHPLMKVPNQSLTAALPAGSYATSLPGKAEVTTNVRHLPHQRDSPVRRGLGTLEGERHGGGK